MQRRNRWIVLGLIVAGLPLSACGGTPAGEAEKSEPATIEQLEGIDRIVLTAEAAERLDLQTAQVEDVASESSSSQQTVIPYAAVLYEPDGLTFTYTSPEPLVFVRQSITVDRIEGDLAYLTDGPPTGTAVVVVGAAELFGTELGVDN